MHCPTCNGSNSSPPTSTDQPLEGRLSFSSPGAEGAGPTPPVLASTNVYDEACDGLLAIHLSTHPQCDTVQIRLEAKGNANTPMMFCTNGILLRKLASRNAAEELNSLTHIIIDEIHERDRFADFMLIILKDVLPQVLSRWLCLRSALPAPGRD